MAGKGGILGTAMGVYPVPPDPARCTFNVVTAAAATAAAVLDVVAPATVTAPTLEGNDGVRGIPLMLD